MIRNSFIRRSDKATVRWTRAEKSDKNNYVLENMLNICQKCHRLRVSFFFKFTSKDQEFLIIN